MGKLENLKPWKPGQSGNPGGRPKRRPVSDELIALLAKDDGKAAKAVAGVLLREALKGDLGSIKEIITRIEGKVPDRVEVASANRVTWPDDDDMGDAGVAPGAVAGEAAPVAVQGTGVRPAVGQDETGRGPVPSDGN